MKLVRDDSVSGTRSWGLCLRQIEELLSLQGPGELREGCLTSL